MIKVLLIVIALLLLFVVLIFFPVKPKRDKNSKLIVYKFFPESETCEIYIAGETRTIHGVTSLQQAQEILINHFKDLY